MSFLLLDYIKFGFAFNSLAEISISLCISSYALALHSFPLFVLLFCCIFWKCNQFSTHTIKSFCTHTHTGIEFFLFLNAPSAYWSCEDVVSAAHENVLAPWPASGAATSLGAAATKPNERAASRAETTRTRASLDRFQFCVLHRSWACLLQTALTFSLVLLLSHSPIQLSPAFS